MKRLRSYGDDLASAGEKDVDRTVSFSSSHHRRFYPKLTENGRRRPSPAIDDDRDRDREGLSSRGSGLRKRGDHHELGDNSFDDREVSMRSVVRKRLNNGLDGFDDREVSRGLRKRVDHDFSDGFDDREGSKGFRKRLEGDGEGFDRRKGFNRHRDRDGGCSSGSLVSPRGGGGGGYVAERDRDRERERIHHSDSFCMSRRDFPKGFRSERHWSRREDSGLSSWRRFDARSIRKDDDDAKSSPVERGASLSSRGGQDGCGATSSRESLRSPRGGIKDVKSPSWSKDSARDSKDSVGDRSKESKKNESMVAESAAAVTTSEIEEGELQPDPLQTPTPERRLIVKLDVKSSAEPASNVQVDREAVNKSYEVKLCQTAESGADNCVTEKEVSQEVTGDGKQLSRIDVEDVKETEKMSSSASDILNKVSACEESKSPERKGSADAVANDEDPCENHIEHSLPSSSKLDVQGKVEEFEETSIDGSSSVKEELKDTFDLEVGLHESNKPVVDEVQKEPESFAHAVKDKGKGVAVCSPDEVSLREDNLLIERNFIVCRDDAMEGPSTRGFELFSSSVGMKIESASKIDATTRAESDKLKLEPLDLSLGLPNVSAPPNSPPRARSVQSFATTLRTGSDCFTTSISFSGSQFVHNPSCSLTHNSVDYDFEQSVKSRPLFQGVDWQALNANDSLPKEVLAKQKSLLNANGSLQLSQPSQGVLNGRVVPGQQGKLSQFSGKVMYQDDVRSPAQSGGSQGTRPEYGKDRKRMMGEESVSRLFRSSSQREMGQVPTGERELVEQMIWLIVSEPVQAMAWRVHELPEHSIVSLKETMHETLVKNDNRTKLHALQEVLRKRSDLILETLLKSHRIQLQIMVSIKTGLPDFIHHADGLSLSDLAEIFLGLKCRNSNCRSALPVDECDCRFCSQKDGFCSSCMCLVCSKFDTASNTCGWVGCDVCNHWCHTDCGLLKSYIRNGRSVNGSQGVSEMQFYCLACEHPSEMFGFVKDVFKTCAPEWKSETLLKELEYMKRIFSASSDTRGKLLHDVSKQLIGRLQAGVNAAEICNQILSFLNDGNPMLGNALESSSREFQLQPLETIRKDATSTIAPFTQQQPIWSKPVASKQIPRTENVQTALPTIDRSSTGGSSWDTDTLAIINTTPVVDELDSIIKIKQAEAQLFQKRADDARREAEGLKRIAMVKSEKIEEEYGNRIGKLRLSEVEDKRREKLGELQMLERSHREYFNMKKRMEDDIKDLLRKMEATRRNLGM